ncbi:MAG: hypothetical protein Q9210_006105 [Variospora velana]
MSLLSLSAIVHWFVDDFWADCLKNIKQLGQLAGLRQDLAVLESPLSPVEIGRIRRALCRFTTLSHLVSLPGASEDLLQAGNGLLFLAFYCEDELEELGCIKDYLVRRLWSVFEQIEDDAVRTDVSSPLWRMALAIPSALPGQHWFSAATKVQHGAYVNHLTTMGLPFLRNLFVSQGLKRAELVMANSWSRLEGIESILDPMYTPWHPSYPDSDGFDGGKYEGTQDFVCDDLENISHGWLYANRGKLAKEHNRRSRKGFRDWGYVMLDSSRLEATGVLQKESDIPTLSKRLIYISDITNLLQS